MAGRDACGSWHEQMGGTVIVVIILPIALVALVTVASIALPVRQARRRQQGQQLIQNDPEQSNLAAEVEQVRHDEGGSTGAAKGS